MRDLSKGPPAFEVMWEQSVMPLVGRRLGYDNGATMEVLRVGWDGVTRRSSLSRTSDIPIEPFLWAHKQLNQYGRVARSAINDAFDGRYSSAITLILAQVPELELLRDPLTLVVRDKHTVSDA